MRSSPVAAALLPLLLGLRLLLGGGAAAQYSSDLCNWKGSSAAVLEQVFKDKHKGWLKPERKKSEETDPVIQGVLIDCGLTHESHKKDVEQVYLRCSEGSIEWMYPTGALIVNLRPNISPASYKHLTVCIKPFKDSAGANIYLEKTGELKLLVRDGERSPSRVYCFGYDQGGLFVEATPQQDISRKITGFQYELMSRGIAADLHTASEWKRSGVGGQEAVAAVPTLGEGTALRKPQSVPTVLITTVGRRVIRGSIQDVTNEAEEQESIIHVGVTKLYRQKSKVFQLTGESGNWRGQIKTLLECGVKPGDGDFLFTGRMHFGEARLGCAPRFRDFQRMYREAKDKGLNPCEIGPD
ncbi:Meteorin-like protein [Willisornis vidua]|uniref:Meteorin-like protein n=1 Tax=Willisornis vidua TaxID=1566151 RepID=A0ABQ9CRD1_9PASS|nr:Meteorin-like protein [Willisornis vidua]